MDIDTRDLKRLEYDFAEAVRLAPKESRQVVQKSAEAMRNGMRRRVAGLRHAPAYPSAVTYESREASVGPEADIGPDKNRRQGALGNIINYGTVKNSPIPHVEPAADEELPRFERAMEDLSVRLLEGR